MSCPLFEQVREGPWAWEFRRRGVRTIGTAGRGQIYRLLMAFNCVNELSHALHQERLRYFRSNYGPPPLSSPSDDVSNGRFIDRSDGSVGSASTSSGSHSSNSPPDDDGGAEESTSKASEAELKGYARFPLGGICRRGSDGQALWLACNSDILLGRADNGGHWALRGSPLFSHSNRTSSTRRRKVLA